MVLQSMRTFLNASDIQIRTYLHTHVCVHKHMHTLQLLDPYNSIKSLV